MLSVRRDLQFSATPSPVTTTSHTLCSFFFPPVFSVCVVLAISCSHFIHLSVSLLCIYRTPVTVRALMWEFIYVLPTLFAFPYCFADVGSSGKEPAVLDHLTPAFMDKHHSDFLRIRDHFSEANGRNKSSGHPATQKMYLLCLYNSINSSM